MISYGSIPNSEDDNETDDEVQEDSYINIELWLLRKDNDGLIYAIVKTRKLDDGVKAVGNMNNNPLLYNRSYEVEFDDKNTEVLTANIIAENILEQVDEE